MKKTRIKKTDYLLPNNDFLVGLGSVFNVTGSYFKYEYSDSPEEADFKAINSDWQNVGLDIKKARDSFEEKHRKEMCTE